MTPSNVLVSVIIPSLVRENLYELVQALEKQICSFEYEIVVVPHKAFDAKKLSMPHVKVFTQADGLGVSYYRNQGIANASGKILAFIDDDEMPQDEHWLANLVEPIQQAKAQITTAGSYIPLKQGYLADSISLLGYPGGAALGFTKLWAVDESGFTQHLCSGNFAIKKSLLIEVGSFAKTLKSGKEDVFLGEALNDKGCKILYVDHATVIHLPRKSLKDFIKWHWQRGKAAFEYGQIKKIDTEKMKMPLMVAKEALKASFLTPYLPMVLLLLFLQNICQGLAFYSMKFLHATKKN